MRRLFCLGAAVCTVFFAAFAGAQAPAPQDAIPPKYPVTHFASYGQINDPILSPDGSKVAFRVYRDSKWLLLIHNLFEKDQASRLLALGDGDLNWVRWAGNERLVIGMGNTSKFEGEDVYVTRAYVLDIATKGVRMIGRPSGSFDGDDIIYIAPDGSYALQSTARSIYDWPEVNKVDLTTNRIDRIQRQREGIFAWEADTDGVLRVGTGVDDVGRLKIVYRSSAADSFRSILRIDPRISDNQYERFWFSIGSDIGYLQTSSQSGRSAIYKYDWKAQKLLETIYANDKVDVDTMWTDYKTGLPQAAVYTDDRYHVKWFDPERQRLQEQLEQSVGNKYAFVVDRARDSEAKVIWVGSASSPGNFYYFLPEVGKMQRIAAISPNLKDAQLAPVEYVSFKARDGMDIPAYTTWPVGRGRNNLPMIIMPHGGPHARDAWEYDYLAQFLANRGYVVVQPNFRGSSGYGKAFEEKGYGQWGRAMQDDLTDAARWMISRKAADAKRVCMFGWSYGGYAAQVAAFKTEGLYRCAASVAGVSDLDSFQKLDRRRFDSKTFKEQKESVRGPDGKTDIDSVSPLKQVAQVSIPLFLAHGDKDGRVDVRQSRRMFEALTKAGKTTEYYEFAKGDHSLSEEKHRAVLLTKLEAFLSKYNPAD
jgi:dipeptidyl aminopeptidase/acylaminoacyl peptidase